MYAIRQGVWWPKPHMKVRPISLAALWHHSAVSQAFRRTQWSRGWMKARRKGIKRSHRHKKSANVPNSYYLEHLPRLPSAIPLYRRSWTVRLLAATEEGAAEKLRGSNATCHLYIFSNFYKLSIHLCPDLVLDQIARLMPITAPVHITNANPSIWLIFQENV